MQTRLTIPLLLAIPAILNAAVSSVTVASSANPAILGHAVTLTAVVTPSSATGAVTFYDGELVLETEPVVSGQATFTTTLLPFGKTPLKAYYSGDAGDSPSSSPLLPQTVNSLLERNLGPPVNYLTGEENYNLPEIAIGDFNGDGKPDLAVANAYSSVTILLGNGDGTFQSTSLPFQAMTVAVGDFNGDGKADLAISNDYLVSVLLGNGDGTFQSPINYGAPGASATSLVVGDFNGDGITDIVTAAPSLNVLLGNGDGTFRPAETAIDDVNSPTSLVTGDFNADGKADLAVSTYGGGIYVFIGNGDGTFAPPVTYVLPGGIYVTLSLVEADFNGDGKVDLAAASEVSGQGIHPVSVLLGNGDGTFQSAVNYSPPAYTEWLAVGDFNGDGNADLAVSGDQLYVMFGEGDGTFPTGSNFGGNYGSIVVADFNGDGRTDLTVIIPGGVGVLLGTLQGSTTTTLQSSLNPSRYPESVTLTATVSPATATGTVNFYNGSTLLGTSDLVDGVADFSLTSLPTGVDSLKAVYNADVNDGASTSPVLKQIVGKTTTSNTLYSNPNPSTVGQTVLFQARITPSSATGTVTFYHGSTVIGTGTLNRGRADLLVSTLPKGEHAITAVYGGDTDDGMSTSSILAQVVK